MSGSILKNVQHLKVSNKLNHIVACKKAQTTPEKWSVTLTNLQAEIEIFFLNIDCKLCALSQKNFEWKKEKEQFSKCT